MSATTRAMLQGLIQVMLWIIAWEPAPEVQAGLADLQATLKKSGDALSAAENAQK